MPDLSSLYLALDIVAFLLTLGVVGFFAALWRRSGHSLHLLMLAGFLLVAAGFLGVSASAFNLQGEPDNWHALRFVGHTAGALVLVLAYASAHQHGAARPWRVAAWTVALMGVILAAIYWIAPPLSRLPRLQNAFVVAHAVQAIAYAGCAAYASSAFRRHPSFDRALVPAAFLSWALSKYTWLLIDLSRAQDLVAFVYGWRFIAIGLLLLALFLPVRHAWESKRRAPRGPEEGPHGTT